MPLSEIQPRPISQNRRVVLTPLSGKYRATRMLLSTLPPISSPQFMGVGSGCSSASWNYNPVLALSSWTTLSSVATSASNEDMPLDFHIPFRETSFSARGSTRQRRGAPQPIQFPISFPHRCFPTLQSTTVPTHSLPIRGCIRHFRREW